MNTTKEIFNDVNAINDSGSSPSISSANMLLIVKLLLEDGNVKPCPFKKGPQSMESILLHEVGMLVAEYRQKLKSATSLLTEWYEAHEADGCGLAKDTGKFLKAIA